MMQISKLILHTTNVAEIQKFYGRLGFPILLSNDDEVRVQVGETVLTFQHSDEEAFYHFALNIPANQLIQSISWLKSRQVPVLTHQGHEVVRFGTPFDADACYFHDPAGNIVELIARHRLSALTRFEFSAESIQCVSEIGLPTQNVRALSLSLCSAFGQDVFVGEDSDEFTAVGDDVGLFIVVKKDWEWLPTGRAAKMFPLIVVLSSQRTLSLSSPENTYVMD
jgi:hypothetical protein